MRDRQRQSTFRPRHERRPPGVVVGRHAVWGFPVSALTPAVSRKHSRGARSDHVGKRTSRAGPVCVNPPTAECTVVDAMRVDRTSEAS
jgi:hypothetical protein